MARYGFNEDEPVLIDVVDDNVALRGLASIR
jgi:hypothetical protein